MQKLILIFLSILFVEVGFSQSLQFVDAKDSLALLSVKLIPMDDGGWISLSTSRDSCINAIKFDFCGKIEWQDKLSTNGKIESVHSIKEGNNIFLTAIINNGIESGVYVLNLDNLGNTQLPGLYNIPNVAIYKNARICLDGKDRVIVFNAGNDSAALVPHFIQISEFNQIKNSLKLNQSLPFHDIVKLEDQYYLTLGNKELLILDNNFSILKALSINAGTDNPSFQSIPKTLDVYSDTSVVIQTNFLSTNTEQSFAYFNLDKNGNIVNHSDKIYYTTGPLGDFFTESGVLASSFFINYKSSNRLANIELNTALKLTKQKLYTLKPEEDSILQMAIAKNTEGNYVLNVNANENYQFKNIKLDRELASACQDTTAEIKTNSLDINTTEISTIKVENFSPQSVQSNVNRRVFDIKLTRLCEKFDLQDGVVPYFLCKGDSISIPTFGVIKKDGEYKQLITYCNKTVTKTHKVTFKDTIIESITIDSTYPLCKYEKVTLKADTSDGYYNIRWFNGVTTDTFTVRLPDTSTVELRGSGCSLRKMTFISKNISCFPEVKFPNVCSPGASSNENKVFLPYSPEPEKIKEWKLMIYNRWGQKVFETNRFNDVWNLTFKGELAATDTYVYVAKGTDIYDEAKEFKGVVTILR